MSVHPALDVRGHLVCVGVAEVLQDQRDITCQRVKINLPLKEGQCRHSNICHLWLETTDCCLITNLPTTIERGNARKIQWTFFIRGPSGNFVGVIILAVNNTKQSKLSSLRTEKTVCCIRYFVISYLVILKFYCN